MYKLFTKKILLHKNTLTNVFWRALTIGFKQGSIFLLFIIASFFLTPTDFSIYNYIFGIILLLMIFSDFGISTTVTKLVAEKNNNTNTIIFNSILISFVFFLLSLVGLVFINSIINQHIENFIYAIPMLFFAPLTSIFDGVFRAEGRFKEISIISFFAFLISIILAVLLIQNLGLNWVIFCNTLVYALSFILLFKYYRKNIISRIDFKVIQKILSYSLIIGLGSIGFILYSRIDILFFGYFGYIDKLNYFEISNKILSLIVIPFMIISQVIFPTIANYWSKKKYAIVYEKAKNYLILSFVFSSIIVLFLWLFSKPIFEIFFTKYSSPEAFLIINLMLIIYFTQMLNGILPSGFAQATSHAKLSTLFLLFFGLVHIILNFYFINLFGYIGIIYSIIISKVACDLIFIKVYLDLLKKEVNRTLN